MKKRDSRSIICRGLLGMLIMVLLTACSRMDAPQQQIQTLGEGDPYVLAMMHDLNTRLQADGMNIAIQELAFFTIGQGRPVNRLRQWEFRWVANDPRRLADGNNLTYIVDQSYGTTTSGLTNTQTEAAIDRSMQTWNADRCLRNLEIVKRPDPGTDITIFDYLLGFGEIGNPLVADIVHAGWYPKELFEVFGGPGGDGILAFSATFIFIDENGNPTDINNDRYLDSALNEVYYNNTYGDPSGGRAGNPWGIDVDLPGLDVESVALHENGHSLGIGHFGSEPRAVMNEGFAGLLQSLSPTDSAGMCSLWAQWPRK